MDYKARRIVDNMKKECKEILEIIGTQDRNARRIQTIQRELNWVS